MLQYLGSAGFICNDVSAAMVRELSSRIDGFFWNKYQRMVLAFSKQAIDVIEIWLSGSIMEGKAPSDRVSVQQLDGQEFWVSGDTTGRPGRLITLRAVEAGSPNDAIALLQSIFAGAQPSCPQPVMRKGSQRNNGTAESRQVMVLRRKIESFETEIQQLRAKNLEFETQNSVIMETMIKQSIAAHSAVQKSDRREASASPELHSAKQSSAAVAAHSGSARRSRSCKLTATSKHKNGESQRITMQQPDSERAEAGPSVDLFKPVGEVWQFQIAAMLQTEPAFSNGCMEHYPPISLGRPIHRARVLGDGNCFFRSISQAINGNQDLHTRLRAALTNWMERNAAYVASLIPNMPAYLQESGMRSLGTWATQNEIHALATALQTTIYVCFLEGNCGYHWTPYIPLIRLDPEPISEAIYLVGGNGHYDLVLDVAPI